ncbi:MULTISPECIES: M20/M25/M40 family metallo-hydrolase [unclassified Fusibacter]|uniref:M20/M25/M40 family metallo-hydrolase n=1 Tax=unclassified Fusibacter TaxID=2624464 RepID=UPI0010132ECE|nr:MULTISPECIES: M20/M25/M40 family metallo-hydrolase [unclassified Fusibacter]MCK8058331.1 M20/M25/M40 family metallo-hydrolase [Fusibacter sp. A2]NPE20914.1 M20/M25/M40 family metallo-hydrolase [Fusibacter sp. A1]RXV63117.1 M20/M25/M40 family metallo-hydrolase [Fusibacter sp. A1]
MIRKDRVVSTFLEYVQIDSPTQAEATFAAVMTKELEALGFQVFIDDAGEALGSKTGNIIAKLKGSHITQPILFGCHLDTASPGIGIKPTIVDDIIYSDQTTVLGADNKAGIAALIEALQVIKEHNLPHGPIEVVLSIFHEGGQKGAKHLNYELLDSKIAYVLDGGGDPGRIVTSGHAKYQMQLYISHMNELCAPSLKTLRQITSKVVDAMHKDKNYATSTASVAVICGASDKHVIQVESASLSAESALEAICKIRSSFEDVASGYSATVTSKLSEVHQTFSVSRHDPMVKCLFSACSSLGLEAYTAQSIDGSDANHYHSNGIKAVNLGIGERKPHTLHEHLHIKDLVNASRLILALVDEHVKTPMVDL